MTHNTETCPSTQSAPSVRPEPIVGAQQLIRAAACKFCGCDTKERYAGEYICSDCYATTGACCSGE